MEWPSSSVIHHHLLSYSGFEGETLEQYQSLKASTRSLSEPISGAKDEIYSQCKVRRSSHVLTAFPKVVHIPVLEKHAQKLHASYLVLLPGGTVHYSNLFCDNISPFGITGNESFTLQWRNCGLLFVIRLRTLTVLLQNCLFL